METILVADSFALNNEYINPKMHYTEAPGDPRDGLGYSALIPSVLMNATGIYVKTGSGNTEWTKVSPVDVIEVKNNNWVVRFGIIFGNLNYFLVGVRDTGVWIIKRIHKSDYKVEHSRTEESWAGGIYGYGLQQYGISPYGGSDPSAWINETMQRFAS
ncbi:MAG: hypothetical protein HQM11_07700 [SAR324 cluster bacterium]|nr:hypothetical protein [SAR324 cluster bacterium]